MGSVYAQRGRFPKALECFETALHLQPDYAEALCNHAAALVKMGQADKAIPEFEKALQIDPNCAAVFSNLGSVLADRGREEEAIPYFEKALELMPDDATIHYYLGMALSSRGRYREAAAHYRSALKFNHDYGEASNNLAMLLSSCPEESIRNGQQAVALAQEAVRLSNGQEPIPLDTLASAYAETGQFQEAVQTEKKAIDLAARQNNLKWLDTFNKKLQLYQTNKPFRASPPQATTPSEKH
jgi:tetratricopeptide (TPR) repeat protein